MMECVVCFTTALTVQVRTCLINSSCRPLICQGCHDQNIRLNQGRCLNGCSTYDLSTLTEGFVISYIVHYDGDYEEYYSNGNNIIEIWDENATIFDSEETARNIALQFAQNKEDNGTPVWLVSICPYNNGETVESICIYEHVFDHVI